MCVCVCVCVCDLPWVFFNFIIIYLFCKLKTHTKNPNLLCKATAESNNETSETFKLDSSTVRIENQRDQSVSCDLVVVKPKVE